LLHSFTDQHIIHRTFTLVESFPAPSLLGWGALAHRINRRFVSHLVVAI
jgi:hypothetical protein